MGYRGKIGRERREGRSSGKEEIKMEMKKKGEERFEDREGQRTEIKIIISPWSICPQLCIYLFQILKKLGYMH